MDFQEKDALHDSLLPPKLVPERFSCWTAPWEMQGCTAAWPQLLPLGTLAFISFSRTKLESPVSHPLRYIPPTLAPNLLSLFLRASSPPQCMYFRFCWKLSHSVGTLVLLCSWPFLLRSTSPSSIKESGHHSHKGEHMVLLLQTYSAFQGTQPLLLHLPSLETGVAYFPMMTIKLEMTPTWRAHTGYGMCHNHMKIGWHYN